MANVAFKKRVEEEHYKNAQVVTNGEITSYTGSKGFCEFLWPNYLTIDLGDIYLIKCIRFLLWDNLGSGGLRDRRKYYYRLLISRDHKIWDVVFDTMQEGFNGWQVFSFPSSIETRYVRIHGLWNSTKSHFHVIEVEAHDDVPPEIDAEYILERTINSTSDNSELGDALPLEHNVQILIKKLEKVLEKYNIINPKPIKSIISQLRKQVKDVSAIEKNLESIRREITDPVQKELEKSAVLGKQSVELGKFSFWGFWVGFIGGLLAIISIIISIFIK